MFDYPFHGQPGRIDDLIMRYRMRTHWEFDDFGAYEEELDEDPH